MYNRLYRIAKDIWGDAISDQEINEFIRRIGELGISSPHQLMEQIALDNYLESFISSVDDIVFELDNDGRIIQIWAADESKMWMKRSEALYKTAHEILPPPLGDALKEAFLKAQQTRMPVEIEYKSPFDDQYFVSRLNIIKNHNPATKHVSVLIKNITEKKKAEEALQKAIKAAEEAANAKSQFLSAMSHEIRTPMNAIIGLTDILLNLSHTEEVKEYLKSIRYSSDNLLMLVNDILNFNKTEIGKVAFEQIDFNLHEQIQELQKTQGLRAKAKQISFETIIKYDVPQMLVGDPYRLNQILINLIGNAIKFTEKGTVQLTVSVLKKEDDKLTLRFEVEDTGIGIPEHKLEEIFERFTQASSDITRKYGGTGLGLAITKNLVLQQQGAIYVKSREGKGTLFTVELQFLQSYEHIPLQTSGFDKKPLDKSTILIVEDNPLNMLIMKKILDEWNVTYYEAQDGREALAIMKKQEVDMVLMDLHMPGMDGIQATAHIRNKDTDVLNPDVPIIAFTADAFPETKIKVLEAGMNDFITKPFKKDELYTKLIRHLHIS